MCQQMCKPAEQFQSYKDSRLKAGERLCREILKRQDPDNRSGLWTEFTDDLDSSLPLVKAPELELRKYGRPFTSKDEITVIEIDGLNFKVYDAVIDPVPWSYNRAVMP